MPLDIKYLTAFSSESAWTNLLAAMMDADRVLAAKWMRLDVTRAQHLRVVREKQFERPNREKGDPRFDRVDIAVYDEDTLVGLIEAKVFAPLGPQQLSRYSEVAKRENRHGVVRRVVITLDVAPVPRNEVPKGWRAQSWTHVLKQFQTSSDTAVALLARDWRARLKGVKQPVDGKTTWGDVRDWGEGNEGYAVRSALLMRGAYLHKALTKRGRDVTWSLSNSGRKAVNEFQVKIPGTEHYSLAIEVEENTSAQTLGSAGDMTGVSVRIGLLMSDDREGVGTEDGPVPVLPGYDWEFFARLYRSYLKDAPFEWHGESMKSDAGSVWVQEGRAYARAVEIPAWALVGFDLSSKSNWLMYGPRYILPTSTTMDDVVDSVDEAIEFCQQTARTIGARGRYPLVRSRTSWMRAAQQRIASERTEAGTD